MIYVNELSKEQSASHITMVEVDFILCSDPGLSKCNHTIPQLFDSSGNPLTEANQYLRMSSRRLAKKSLKTIAEHIKEFSLWILTSRISLTDVSDSIFDSYIDALCGHTQRNGQALSWNTVDARSSGAYRFLIWCHELGYCTDLSPTESINTRYSSRKKYQAKGNPSQKLRDHTKFLLLDDAIKFVISLASMTGTKDTKVKMRNRLVGELMLQSGLRISEIVNFPLKDLPEVNDRGHSTITRVMGKGNKARAILIPNSLLLRLWEYVDFDRENISDKMSSLAGSEIVDTTLFLNSNGRRLTINWVEKIFQKISNKLNLKTTPHTLRHTFGTYHYLLNKDLTGLSKLMGHEKESTTSSYYVHTAILASYSGTHTDFQKEIDKLIVGSNDE